MKECQEAEEINFIIQETTKQLQELHWPANIKKYTSELIEAYAYAKTKNITTMTTIEEAKVFDTLNRIAMAKMISNFAIEVLNLQLDTNKDCDFPDVSSSLDTQYDNGVTKACQLWLMWVNVDKFNPFENVNRAQFGTVLSRVLNGSTYNTDWEDWYIRHLQDLKNRWIITNDSPWMEELRWYVMLMIMRTSRIFDN